MPKVTVHKHKVADGYRWVVSRFISGKRKRSFYDSKSLAESEAKRIAEEFQQCGTAWINLSPRDQSDLMRLYQLAKERNLNLQELLNRAASGPVVSRVTLSKAIGELIEIKSKSGRSPKYVKGLQLVLEQFSKDRESVEIAGVTLANVEAFLDSKNLASRSTLRSRLSTLFKFAVRRGYRIDNPCAALEPVRVTKPPPRIFTIAEVESCLKWLTTHRKHVLPWFVLSTFCGLRPEEAEKTTAADIDFREGFIRVEAQTTKVRQRRVVYPKVEVMAMLKRLPAVKALNPQRRRRAIRALREHLGWKVWPKDITRHTAASYWLADSQSAAAVAESLGHSETVLKRNYKALVTKEQSRKFWSLAQT
jgi:integrase